MEELRKEENKMPLTIDKETIEKHPLYKDGVKKGIETGKLEAKKEAVINLHKKTGWNFNKIAEVLELPVEFVIEVLGKRK